MSQETCTKNAEKMVLSKSAVVSQMQQEGSEKARNSCSVASG